MRARLWSTLGWLLGRLGNRAWDAADACETRARRARRRARAHE